MGERGIDLIVGDAGAGCKKNVESEPGIDKALVTRTINVWK
jgi:hypothetical protein